jgi:hypothetical protein
MQDASPDVRKDCPGPFAKCPQKLVVIRMLEPGAGGSMVQKNSAPRGILYFLKPHRFHLLNGKRARSVVSVSKIHGGDDEFSRLHIAARTGA